MKMESAALVELALTSLSCDQKDLAARLKVSPTQISKWKKGEHLSPEMEKKLRTLSKIGERDPEFVLAAGSIKDADDWAHLIDKLANIADEEAETGYTTDPLQDDMGLLAAETFSVLEGMGVAFPARFPPELDDLDFAEEDSWDAIEKNPYSKTIYEMFKTLNDVYGFYTAYVSELINDEDLALEETAANNIQPALLSLAASKMENVNLKFAPKFNEFQRRTVGNYEEWLGIVKDKAFRAGVPLRAELMEMVHESHDALGHAAERESMGFNSSRLHPDIYMNELLVGMRMIHQVLPAMLKKLGLEKEFMLDHAKLSLEGHQTPVTNSP
jgi:transcriptional regulator with XRE-family HTH domain